MKEGHEEDTKSAYGGTSSAYGGQAPPTADKLRLRRTSSAYGGQAPPTADKGGTKHEADGDKAANGKAASDGKRSACPTIPDDVWRARRSRPTRWMCGGMGQRQGGVRWQAEPRQRRASACPTIREFWVGTATFRLWLGQNRLRGHKGRCRGYNLRNEANGFGVLDSLDELGGQVVRNCDETILPLASFGFVRPKRSQLTALGEGKRAYY